MTFEDYWNQFGAAEELKEKFRECWEFAFQDGYAVALIDVKDEDFLP